MSSSSTFLLTFSLLLTISYLSLHFSTTNAQIHDLGFNWASPSAMSIVYPVGNDLDDDYFEDEIESDGSSSRRSLYWKKPHQVYYISYGALSANRVPCPPRSGRSYYTHNCFKTRTPANPYHRGCSCISRCRR
ncbi:hypothetical protein BVRB_008520 [Beta vulgaris subsp. vulgaris]|uniref:Protein RALF-like 34 n=1 Tax=Beta vulgaris subsp. vulgaris TaxID=3555 RepID=A0A0J8B2P8_BETVV|nr:protein RALF-like 34 [Beta vulgaris subsp. vulgaris]KMS95394.1 hypothetical protein BVRB_008520 [Beta vulgaris subsp. vulgaris]